MAREYINGEPVLLVEDELAIGDKVRFVRREALDEEDSATWYDDFGLNGLYTVSRLVGVTGDPRYFRVLEDHWGLNLRKGHFTWVSHAVQQPATSANNLNITQFTCPHCQNQISVAVEQGSNLRVVPPPNSFTRNDWEGITLVDLLKLPKLPAGQQYAIVKNNPPEPDEWPIFTDEMREMIGKVIIVDEKKSDPEEGDFYLGRTPNYDGQRSCPFWWRPEWLVLLGDIESWYEFEVPDEPRRVRRITLKTEGEAT